MTKDPRVADLFKNTNLGRQAMVLKNSVAYMIMYADGSRIAETKLEEIGVSHDRNHFNIAPTLYDYWMEALLETVRHYNPNLDDALEKMWRHVLQIGVSRIKSMY